VIGVAQHIFYVKDRLREIKLSELTKEQKTGGCKKNASLLTERCSKISH